MSRVSEMVKMALLTKEAIERTPEGVLSALRAINPDNPLWSSGGTPQEILSKYINDIERATMRLQYTEDGRDYARDGSDNEAFQKAKQYEKSLAPKTRRGGALHNIGDIIKPIWSNVSITAEDLPQWARGKFKPQHSRAYALYNALYTAPGHPSAPNERFRKFILTEGENPSFVMGQPNEEYHREIAENNDVDPESGGWADVQNNIIYGSSGDFGMYDPNNLLAGLRNAGMNPDDWDIHPSG